MNRMRLFGALIVLLFTSLEARAQAHDGQVDALSLEDLRGNWLGSIEISPGTSIRQAIQVIRKADGSLGANFASIDQGVLFTPDVSIELQGNRFMLTAGTLGILIQGNVSDRLTTIDATISQGSVSDPVLFVRVPDLPESGSVASSSEARSSLRTDENVRFENGADGVWLGGTLARPAGTEPVPAIVFVSGSGPAPRDYSTSLAISDYLVDQGYAVLRYDKRGVFQSTGLFGEADEAAFARDAAAAWRYLESRVDIDESRIGFIGHSEGSQVSAQAVAEYDAGAAFLVSMAGVGLTAVDTTIIQDGTESAAAGATSHEVELLQEFSRRFYATVMAEGETEESRLKKLRALYEELAGEERDVVLEWNGPYGLNTGTLNPRRASSDLFAASMRLDAPTKFWREIEAPVLVLGGGRDSQVPASDHVQPILDVLTHSQSRGIVFPSKNHMFQTAKTGSVDEYAEISEPIAPDVLAAVGEWLEETM